jgi:hypothetical protein
MLYFEPSQTLPTPLLRTIQSSVRRGEKKSLQMFILEIPRFLSILIKFSNVMCQKNGKITARWAGT